MQFFKSPVELSFAKTAIISSGGKRLIGETRCSRSRLGDTVISRNEATPIEDCESLRWAVKKSVSSSSMALSGELEEETDVESLGGCTDRLALAMLLGLAVQRTL